MKHLKTFLFIGACTFFSVIGFSQETSTGAVPTSSPNKEVKKEVKRVEQTTPAQEKVVTTNNPLKVTNSGNNVQTRTNTSISSEKRNARSNNNTSSKKLHATRTTTNVPGKSNTVQTNTTKSSIVTTNNTLSATTVDIDEATKRIASAKAKLEKEKADGLLTEEQYQSKVERLKQAEIYIKELQVQIKENTKIKE